MFNPIHHKSATLPLPNSISRSPLRRGLLLIPLAVALAWFALPPPVQGQDGDELNHNTAEGAFALHTYIVNATACFNNTALGFNTLASNITGGNNTATGFDALFGNTSGSFNTATGYGALLNNNADYMTATGFEALTSNTTGTNNTATGAFALDTNTIGSNNTANGNAALHLNTTGSGNTTNGVQSLFSNTVGNDNTANGYLALLLNTTGNFNTATGVQALRFNTTGNANTAAGLNALYHSTTASNNSAAGFDALFNNTTGSNNIALGYQAGFNLTTGSNNIDIGNAGVAGEANTTRIGTVGTQTATFIAGISGTALSGTAVVVSSSGQLGVAPSSQRFKDAIKPMDKASEAILSLEPVTFRYKHELDPDGIPQFGLVAEEVEKVNPALVARDANGKVYTVRYEAVNAMLLNEFLKEHRKVEEQGRREQEQEATITQVKSTVAKQEATIAQQQKEFAVKIALQQKQIETLTAGLQNVSAQVEVSKATPQMVVNNQ
jgi:hypothetical protein